MKLRLDLIETRLQALIEEWIIPTTRGNIQVRMAHQLVNAMQEHLSVDHDGHTIAPDQYTIYLHPDLLQSLDNQRKLSTHLSDGILQVAHEVGIDFISPPHLEFAADAALTMDGMTVIALSSPPSLGDTAIFRPLSDLQKDLSTRGAFLIINGIDVFPLPPTVINIGRRSDNHVVINDVRVSRAHAQIRFNRGQFVLLDLNSTAGTTVNGQSIHQYTLRPGDVISLAGVSIIYGEETNSLDDPGMDENLSDHTQAMRPPANEPSSHSARENDPGKPEHP
jgi:hypothetical protein